MPCRRPGSTLPRLGSVALLAEALCGCAIGFDECRFNRFPKRREAYGFFQNLADAERDEELRIDLAEISGGEHNRHRKAATSYRPRKFDSVHSRHRIVRQNQRVFSLPGDDAGKCVARRLAEVNGVAAGPEIELNRITEQPLIVDE